MTDKLLDGKVILVTGASRGIGREVALEAARHGAELIITGRTTGALEEVDDEIAAAGVTPNLLRLSVGIEGSDLIIEKLSNAITSL